MNYYRYPVMAALALGLGCGGNQDAPASGETPEAAAPSQAAAPAEAGREAAVGGPVDQALADQGSTLFQTKACIGCHTIGAGRLTGPDLEGVTERRTRDWMIAMIMNPDSMIKNDETARQLFAEYMTPMLSMNVTRDEAQAIYEYLKRESE